jgi:tyrosine-protein phosphatase non-receptor type 9
VREKLRDRVYTVSVPQLSLHIPRDSLPIHLGGTLRIDHSTWLLYCSKSMTNREEDELLSQQEVVVVGGSSGESGGASGSEDIITDAVITGTVDPLNNVEATELVVATNGNSNGSIEIDSGTNTLNGSNDAAASQTNGTNETEIVVVAGQRQPEETNGIITEIHWNENPPSSASPSSGFSDDDSLTGAHEGDPKTIEQIVDMVRSMGRKGVLKEYAEIRARQPDGTFEHAKLRSNLIKNRYTDVLCYDHSRVVLSTAHDADEDQTNDYINANFVDGYKQKNAYISTQGECFTFEQK